MIKVFFKWKLYKEFKDLDIKNNQDIIKVYNFLTRFQDFEACEIPPLCEDILQQIMRSNWYTLESF